MLNRPAPKMAPSSYKTYQIAAPTKTHWRRATCAEVECPHYVNGWRVRMEGLDDQMLHTAKNSGRTWRHLAVSMTENWLVYEAGQPCFQAVNHRKRIDREEIFIVRHGDWRQTFSSETHANPENWQTDFAEHQDKLATEQQKG